MSCEVIFYEDKDGSPVKDFLRGLPSKKVRKKANKFIFLLEERGNEMPSDYAKHLRGYSLWELIINFQKNAYRIFYCFEGKRIILLHGFVKKTEETPTNEIHLALGRWEAWKRVENC
jgi:phage-related protein